MAAHRAGLADLLPVHDAEDTRPIIKIIRTYEAFARELHKDPTGMARLISMPHEHNGRHGTSYQATRGHEDRLVVERLQELYDINPDYLLLYGVPSEQYPTSNPAVTEPQDGSAVFHTSAIMPFADERAPDDLMIVSLGDIARAAHKRGATIELNPDLPASQAGLSFVIRGMAPDDVRVARVDEHPIELHAKRAEALQLSLARRATSVVTTETHAETRAA
jgi:hypothetical protein